eukprot:TRINITY_DN7405_c0_g2_i1.p1 TRINITY_DN7405_c0_g2~~TRINITY_DN7405_c0_g2_i1.p1  ORF type:complete len:594 (-),score=70.86 TRINITY_DN7405_c0_g2_i1:1238-3019(-)
MLADGLPITNAEKYQYIYRRTAAVFVDGICEGSCCVISPRMALTLPHVVRSRQVIVSPGLYSLSGYQRGKARNVAEFVPFCDVTYLGMKHANLKVSSLAGGAFCLLNAASDIFENFFEKFSLAAPAPLEKLFVGGYPLTGDQFALIKVAVASACEDDSGSFRVNGTVVPGLSGGPVVQFQGSTAVLLAQVCVRVVDEVRGDVALRMAETDDALSVPMPYNDTSGHGVLRGERKTLGLEEQWLRNLATGFGDCLRWGHAEENLLRESRDACSALPVSRTLASACEDDSGSFRVNGTVVPGLSGGPVVQFQGSTAVLLAQVCVRVVDEVRGDVALRMAETDDALSVPMPYNDTSGHGVLRGERKTLGLEEQWLRNLATGFGDCLRWGHAEENLLRESRDACSALPVSRTLAVMQAQTNVFRFLHLDGPFPLVFNQTSGTYELYYHTENLMLIQASGFEVAELEPEVADGAAASAEAAETTAYDEASDDSNPQDYSYQPFTGKKNVAINKQKLLVLLDSHAGKHIKGFHVPFSDKLGSMFKATYPKDFCAFCESEEMIDLAKQWKSGGKDIRDKKLHAQIARDGRYKFVEVSSLML